MIAPEPLHLIDTLYRRAGKVWRAVELRREPDHSVGPKPYPERPWEVLLKRSDTWDAYWINCTKLEAGELRFKLVPSSD